MRTANNNTGNTSFPYNVTSVLRGRARNILALLLAIVLIISLLPIPFASAAADEAKPILSRVFFNNYTVSKKNIDENGDSVFTVNELSIKQLSETVFLIEDGPDGKSAKANYSSESTHFQFNFSDGVEITKMWNSDEFVYDLNYEHPYKPYKNNKKVEASLKAYEKENDLIRINGQKNAVDKHSYYGCYYFQLNNGKIITAIFPCTGKPSPNNLRMDAVSLSKVATKTLAEGENVISHTLLDEYVFNGFYNDNYDSKTDSIISTTLYPDELENSVVLSAKVDFTYANEHSKYDYKSISTSSGNNQQWPEAIENYILVNGERIGNYFGSSTEMITTYSEPFTLQNGLNVVEVCCITEGFKLNGKNEQWFAGSSSDRNKVYSLIYLIDYKGEPAEIQPTGGKDTGIQEGSIGAYISSSEKVPFNKREIEITDSGYVFSIPESYKEAPSDAKYSYQKGAVITVAPNDYRAKVEIVDNEEGALVSGTRSGYCFGINLFNLPDDDTFTVRVTSGDGTEIQDYHFKVVPENSDTNIYAFSVNGAQLDEHYSNDTYCYYLEFDEDSTEAELNIELADGAIAQLNDKVTGESFVLSSDNILNTITITAPDGITHKKVYFITKLPDGSVPYFTITEETRAQAAKMLEGYYDLQKNLKSFGGIWPIFMAAAAGSGLDEDGNVIPMDFNGKYVFDPTEDLPMLDVQSTFPARDIMTLVMLGRNPYDFNGINFVEKLQEHTGEPWANNIWYDMAAKAAGIEPLFEDSMKKNAASRSYDLDMRAWTIAVLNNSFGLEQKDMVPYIESLRNVQIKPGYPNGCRNVADYAGLWRMAAYYSSFDTNAYTIGTVLSAIASAGVDPNVVFTVEDEDGSVIKPLDKIEKFLWDEEKGRFMGEAEKPVRAYVKDMIIGLGDILQGSNVWDRYRLSEDKYDALLSKAGAELSSRVASATNLSKIPKYGEEDYGKYYFYLYDAVADKTNDTTMRPDVIWGTPINVFKKMLDTLPKTDSEDYEDNINLTEVEKLIAFYKELYDYDEGKTVSTLDVKSKAAFDKAVETAMNKREAAERPAEDREIMTGKFYSRVIELPDPRLIKEENRKEVEELGAIFDGFSDYQKTIIEQYGVAIEGKLSKCLLVLMQNSGSSGGGSSRPQTITIRFKLLGAPNDGEFGEVNTLMDNNLEPWLPDEEGKYYIETFNAESISAEDVLLLILNDNGIEWRGNSENQYGTIYISGIRNPKTGVWMEEFTTTANSGWMYTVNGKHPNVGLSNFYLKNGDEFIMHFTDDYTKEEDAAAYMGGGNSENKDDKDKKDEEKSETAPVAGKVVETVKVEAKADAKGVAAAKVEAKAVADAVKNAAEKKAESIVIAPEVSGDAKEVKVELPKASVSEIAKSTDAALVIATDKGSVEVPNEVLAEIAKQADGANVEISVAVKSVEDATVKEAIGDKVGDDANTDNAAVAEITVTSGDKKITTFSGKMINASVSVDGKKGFAEGRKYLTLVISENGKRELLAGKCSKGADGKLNVGVKVGHLSTFVVLDKELKSFADAEAHWSADAVDFAVANGLMNGTSDTAFAPNMTLNRAMLVTILYRLAGSPVAMATDKFTDVAAGQWYSDAVAWAAANGIVTGKTETTFAPMDNITREQFATMLMRYCKFAGVDTAKNADLTAFTDSASISNYAKDALAWANASGIITGRTATTIAPTGSATRGEAATMLMRFMQM